MVAGLEVNGVLPIHGLLFISTSGECKHGVVSRLGSSRLGLGGGLLALYNTIVRWLRGGQVI